MTKEQEVVYDEFLKRLDIKIVEFITQAKEGKIDKESALMSRKLCDSLLSDFRDYRTLSLKFCP